MILYHYCSNHAFQSIINKKEIWLSSLSLTNDPMEGKWLRKVFGNVCADNNLDESATRRVIKEIGRLDELVEGLGFSLSEHGDMLSQWRGYASDASGMCIGFSKSYFEDLAEEIKAAHKPLITLIQVEYGAEEQKTILYPTYREIKQFIDKGAFQYPGHQLLIDPRPKEDFEAENKKRKKALLQLTLRLMFLLPDLFKLKNPAFSEEREWRLISNFIKYEDNECEFRATSDRIIPYRIFNIPPKENGPISEIILGPKNITPVDLIEIFLKKCGFAGVKVTRSEATYR